jgi:hypothetical protein
MMSRVIIRRLYTARRAGGGSATLTLKMIGGIRACYRLEKRAARHRSQVSARTLSSAFVQQALLRPIPSNYSGVRSFFRRGAGNVQHCRPIALD